MTEAKTSAERLPDVLSRPRAAQTQHSRAELIRLADKFLELAKSARADFGPVLEALANLMKEPSGPVVGSVAVRSRNQTQGR